jgi:hypothetical protein
MQQQTLADRVTILEQKMESLQGLPDRVTALELQISQFREEVRLEFSATRSELRAEMSDLAETLRGEIRAGDEETRRYMSVLHEDVISRIALLGENLNGPTRPRRAHGRQAGTKPRSPKR